VLHNDVQLGANALVNQLEGQDRRGHRLQSVKSRCKVA
jgi:hypothetical protein